MPLIGRRKTVTGADQAEETKETVTADTGTDPLAAAEEAEAEAAEAEAAAAAARARAKAIRLRQEAEARTKEAQAEQETQEAVPENEPEEKDSDSLEEVLALSGQAPNNNISVVKIVLAVLLVLFSILGAAGLLTVSYFMHRDHTNTVHEQELRAEYMAAGRQSVVTLMSLDFNNAQDDVRRIIENSTGQFKKDFESQAEDFVKVAQDSKVVTDVTVNTAAVESMSEDKATVLVSATSRVTNAAGAKQEPRAWRLSVDLERDGGQIKMSKVEFVP